MICSRCKFYTASPDEIVAHSRMCDGTPAARLLRPRMHPPAPVETKQPSVKRIARATLPPSTWAVHSCAISEIVLFAESEDEAIRYAFEHTDEDWAAEIYRVKGPGERGPRYGLTMHVLEKFELTGRDADDRANRSGRM